MEKLIEEIVKECLSNIKNQNNDVGLLTGSAGNVLLQSCYYRWKKKDPDDNLISSFQLLLDNSISYKTITFANGKSGINWFFQYICSEQLLLEDSLCNEICDDFPLLQEMSITELKNGNWDYLHGSIGIAYASLYQYKDSFDIYIENFIHQLQDIACSNETTNMPPNYSFQLGEYNKQEVNFGLAHGITSVLKFCIECCKRKVSYDTSIVLGNAILRFLMDNHNVDTRSSYFPSIFSLDSQKSSISRLAWCYGDLGIGFILYQAGKVFKNTKISDFALEVLKHSTSRRTIEETMVYDAGICHGSAGVAHIYNKMWYYTKDPIFKEATDFWIQKTVDFAVHKDGVAGYKMFNPQDSSYSKSYGLLEGTAGIGLVLLSYLTGDFSWDYCLMLND